MPALLQNSFAFDFLGLALLTLFFLFKLSWSKSLVKKWFNIKNKAEDFHSDEVLSQGDSSIFPITLM